MQRTRWPRASSSKSTATRVIGSGWHSGISSAVRLAAWIAAMRATPITSPFFGAARRDQRKRRRLHPDRAAGRGDAVGLGLGRDVDHVGLALRIEMGQR